MKSSSYQAELDKWEGQGYRLTHVSGYSDGAQPRFAAIWEQTSGPPLVARHGMNSSEFQDELDKWLGEGYRLTHISGYDEEWEPRYAAIWEKVSGLPLLVRHGLNAASYQSQLDNQFYTGYRLTQLSAFTVGDSSRFAAVWEGHGFSEADMAGIDEKVEHLMAAKEVPGLSIAIAKGGRLVFAKGYGYADRANQVMTGPKHLFRIASISKPITSVGIMTLIQQGKLRLHDKVFGETGVLGTRYGDPECVTAESETHCVQDITIQHLLEHTAGAWNNTIKDQIPDPLFSMRGLDQAELIVWTLSNQPLYRKPGSVNDYSNFGYNLLGRVIEKLSGQSYEAFMLDILGQAGVKDMHIAGDTRAEKRTNEVAYYDRLGDPYEIKVRRMDAAAGWVASVIDLARLCVALDGSQNKPDLLSASTMKSMLIRSTSTVAETSFADYAKGFLAYPEGWWHNGILDGTTAVLMRWNDYCVASAANTRIDEFGEAFYTFVDQVVWGENVESDTDGDEPSWPDYDLF